MAGELDAVHVRHVDVGQHEIGRRICSRSSASRPLMPPPASPTSGSEALRRQSSQQIAQAARALALRRRRSAHAGRSAMGAWPSRRALDAASRHRAVAKRDCRRCDSARSTPLRTVVRYGAGCALRSCPWSRATRGCLGVEVQREALAHVAERHLVARVMTACRRARTGSRSRALRRVRKMLIETVPACSKARCRDRRRSRAAAAARAAAPAHRRACSSSSSRRQPLAEAQLLELEILAAQLDFVGQRRELAVVAHQHAEQSRPCPAARLGAAGSLRTSESTALMLLNRKCGRIRACSACRRASAIAGDSARARSWK